MGELCYEMLRVVLSLIRKEERRGLKRRESANFQGSFIGVFVRIGGLK